jgi:c-di-GMP-binding flagellar brake protein YcgR
MAEERNGQSVAGQGTAGQVAAGAASDRRRVPRYGTDADSNVLMIQKGLEVGGKLENLSLSGCCIETRVRCALTAGMRIEMSFKINSISLRLNGVVQWADGWRRMGIIFTSMSERRRAELANVIQELAAEALAEAAEEAALAQEAALIEGVAPAEAAQPHRQAANGQLPALVPLNIFAVPADAARPVSEAAQPELATPAVAPGRERRLQKRQQLDVGVSIYPIRAGGKVNGVILDLSVGGCRIRTGEKLQVGIHTHVELGFVAQGLPFRVPGVIQSLYGRQQVGIRFIDVTERNREKLQSLMGELEEKATREATMAAADDGVEDGEQK